MVAFTVRFIYAVVVVVVEVLKLKLIFFFDSSVQPFEGKGDLDGISQMLEQLKKKGFIVKQTDVRDFSEADVYDIYMEAMIPSVRKKYRIRQVFGSQRHSGFLFAKHVPALLVYENPKAQHPSDVYPREEGRRLVGIEDFLRKLL